MDVVRRPLGGLEAEILICPAAAAHPITPAQVLSDLGGGLAYTTVMTALGRLHRKHALTRQPFGRGYAYTVPVGGPCASATAHRMMRLLDGGPDRSGALARFVAELSPEDEQLLRKLLADADDDDDDGTQPDHRTGPDLP